MKSMFYTKKKISDKRLSATCQLCCCNSCCREGKLNLYKNRIEIGKSTFVSRSPHSERFQLSFPPPRLVKLLWPAAPEVFSPADWLSRELMVRQPLKFFKVFFSSHFSPPCSHRCDLPGHVQLSPWLYQERPDPSSWHWGSASRSPNCSLLRRFVILWSIVEEDHTFSAGGVLSLWAGKEVVQTLVAYKVNYGRYSVKTIPFLFPGYGCRSTCFGFDRNQHERRSWRTD